MSRNNSTSFWQSPLWEAILSETHQAETFWYNENDIPWLVERRTLVGSLKGLYVLGVEANTITPERIVQLKKMAQKNDIFIQIEPITYYVGEQKEESKKKKEGIDVVCPLDKGGQGGLKNENKAPFRRFLEPTTAIIPLTGMTEESLIQRFEEKGRYNIRVAQRRGLTAHWVSGDEISTYSLPGKKTDNMTNTELFFSLLRETTERDKFSHNSLSYYSHFLSVLEKNNAGGLLFVTKDNTLHAAGIFVYTEKQGIYYYGASSNTSEIRRDNGTYLLQWEAMCGALRRGCSEYDFLGISSEQGDKLAGVTAFKMRFAPEKVLLPEEKIVILRPIILMFLKIVSRIRKMIRSR